MSPSVADRRATICGCGRSRWPNPDRFAGFATLPTADPHAAADELERATGELGFGGGLVNSTLGSTGAFLDDARFEPLLDRFEGLDARLRAVIYVMSML